MEDAALEKRKKAILSPEESSLLRWLYVKTLLPMGIAIAVSSTVLYLGLKFLMDKTGFANYGMAPMRTMNSVTKFISTYVVIAASNIVVMITLSAIVMYLVLHDLVLPIIRITRELKESMETHSKKAITIRTTDRLLKPLVDLINKLIA